MKILIAVLIVIILVLIAVILFNFVTLKPAKPLTRIPDMPGASSFQYTPPPRPKFPIPSKKQLDNIRAMMKKTVEKVTEGVYIANNYGFGNVVMIETANGLVIVDTTEKAKYARTILAEFRKLTDKPVKTIIYTHGHVDHVFGTPVFKDKNTQVISTRTTVEFFKKEQGWLAPYLKRCRQIQAGRADEAYAMKMPIDVGFEGFEGETLVWPTIIFDKEYSFKQDDTDFVLYETGGEAPGHLIIWIPQKKCVVSGDLFYRSFPNLSTPMLSARSAEDWIGGLGKIISLAPDYLAPCHGLSLKGKDEILTTLTNYRDATKYVFDETVQAINDGNTVEQAVNDIRLPDKFSSQPYLHEYYGRVDWAVRGIYHRYTGWYDGWGTNLKPLPPGYLSREIIKLSGGVDTILTAAIEAQKRGEHQLAVELSDIVIKANPDEKIARAIKSYSLDYLGYLGQNINMFGFYRSAAAMEREKAGVKP